MKVNVTNQKNISEIQYTDSQILNTYAMCLEYSKWSWDFCKKEIREIYEAAKKYINVEDLDSIPDMLKNKKTSSKTEQDLLDGYLKVRELLLTMRTSTDDNREDIRSKTGAIKQQYKDSLTLENLSKLNHEVLEDYGFKPWSGNYYLIPLWAVNLLSDDIEVGCIMVGKVETLGTCDKDVRFGCIAFGFNCVG